jgi:hypothetical protein
MNRGWPFDVFSFPIVIRYPLSLIMRERGYFPAAIAAWAAANRAMGTLKGEQET